MKGSQNEKELEILAGRGTEGLQEMEQSLEGLMYSMGYWLMSKPRGLTNTEMLDRFDNTDLAKEAWRKLKKRGSANGKMFYEDGRWFCW